VTSFPASRPFQPAVAVLKVGWLEKFKMGWLKNFQAAAYLEDRS
jgi:hypothetical protein